MGKFIDLAGKQFYRLNVIRLDTSAQSCTRPRVKWVCRCVCGSIVSVTGENLRSGHTTSCGCFKREKLRTHKMTNTPEWSAWKHMKQRCLDTNHPKYPRYGGRGITIYNKWVNSFKSFYESMGARPSTNHSLDRVDNNKGYFPDNCEWRSRKEQQQNTEKNRIFYATNPIGRRYISKCQAQFARDHKLNASTINTILNANGCNSTSGGWTFQYHTHE